VIKRFVRRTIPFAALLIGACSPLKQPLRDADASLSAYRAELASFRAAYGVSSGMPGVRFFLFGMGNRPKLVYAQGELRNAFNGAVLKHWAVKRDVIVPPEYRVVVLDSADRVDIVREDSLGMWLERDGESELLPGTEARVALPDFPEAEYPGVMRVLLQEVLVNMVGGRPVPNFLTPVPTTVRDDAAMAACLETTGNLGLVREWIHGLPVPPGAPAIRGTGAGSGEALSYLRSLASGRPVKPPAGFLTSTGSPTTGGRDYPLTFGTGAAGVPSSGMAVVDTAFIRDGIIAPQAAFAAEWFLILKNSIRTAREPSGKRP
jgi:hypothetical protein